MKKLEELFDELLADESAREELARVSASEEGVAAFLKERGCDAGFEEWKALLSSKQGKSLKLSDDELDQVSAGGSSWITVVSQIDATCDIVISIKAHIKDC